MALERLNEYITGLYAETDRLTQKQYLAETDLQEFRTIVDDNVARLLKLLLRLTKAQRVLEIGTGIGFSTASMAQAIKESGGRIVTVEFDERVADQALTNFERFGVSAVIELLIGDAEDLVPQLEGEFDLIFLDVGKELYPRVFPDCVRLLRRGGVLVADDALFPVLGVGQRWDHLIPPIEEFNRLVATSQELESTILLVGDGITVAVKK